MIRRAFLRRMMGAALASGLLGSELLARRGRGILPEDAQITYQGQEIGGVTNVRNHVRGLWSGGAVDVRDEESVRLYGEGVVVIDMRDEPWDKEEYAHKVVIQTIKDLAMPQERPA